MKSTSSQPVAGTPYRAPDAPPVARSRGVVKWFNDAKGFGFIAPETGGKDIFVHFSGINGKGHKQLEEKQEVEFEIEQNEKGIYAARVVVIAPAPTD